MRTLGPNERQQKILNTRPQTKQVMYIKLDLTLYWGLGCGTCWGVCNASLSSSCWRLFVAISLSIMSAILYCLSSSNPTPMYYGTLFFNCQAKLSKPSMISHWPSFNTRLGFLNRSNPSPGRPIMINSMII